MIPDGVRARLPFLRFRGPAPVSGSERKLSKNGHEKEEEAAEEINIY